MKNASPTVPQRLKPRKLPLQRRSGATVEAIHEAVIQVLLAEGLGRLTTTRVAERAGCSVGTLYQYFPNKEALLFAILQSHFEDVVAAIEAIDIGAVTRPLADLADALADAYVSVKVARPDATTALYRVAGAIDQFRLSSDVFGRLQSGVVRVLESASDVKFREPGRTAFTLLAALAGLSRASFGALVSETDILLRLKVESRLLARSYLAAAARQVEG
ncbi:TetR/AcrR family transcriptional regulator [Shinella sp.]|uniref:TetR/AcrR family transcriptional regulator n=1 Tax=Shinella sp. TaxID=1870904 RepID=UPI003F716344